MAKSAVHSTIVISSITIFTCFTFISITAFNWTEICSSVIVINFSVYFLLQKSQKKFHCSGVQCLGFGLVTQFIIYFFIVQSPAKHKSS